MIKYRFKFEEFESHHKINGKLVMKDEMIWILNHIVVGFTALGDKYIINHYNESFDLTEYVEVSEEYNSKNYCSDWWDFQIKEWEKEESYV